MQNIITVVYSKGIMDDPRADILYNILYILNDHKKSILNCLHNIHNKWYPLYVFPYASCFWVVSRGTVLGCLPHNERWEYEGIRLCLHNNDLRQKVRCEQIGRILPPCRNGYTIAIRLYKPYKLYTNHII